MQVVVMAEHGPPSVLVAQQAPDPELAPGEALIEVHAASVTFVETQLRAGDPPSPAMAPTLPIVLGNGVAGVVHGVGAGADPRLVGARVVTTLGGSGGYAERVTVPAEWLISVPNGVSLLDAAALLADGRTALMLLRLAAVRPGETVLVEAAAGGVGSLLVQLARRAGANVVAAAGGERKLALARELGAVVAVDYRDPDWAARVRATCDGVDVVFDGVGGPLGEAAFALLRAGGRFVPFGRASGAWSAVGDPTRRDVEVVRPGPLPQEESRELTREALAEAAAGRLRPVVGQTFPLAQAAEAHAAIEARETVGKTLLLTARGARSTAPAAARG